MTAMIDVKNVPVWVDKNRCKACDICASVCPAGVLAMKYDSKNTLGSQVQIIHPESCIGCTDCELSCPDFAIHVSSKDEFNFAKLTNEAKERALYLKENNFRLKD